MVFLSLAFFFHTGNEKIFKSYVTGAVHGAVPLSPQHSRDWIQDQPMLLTKTTWHSYTNKYKKVYHWKHNSLFSFTIKSQHAMSCCVVSFPEGWRVVWVRAVDTESEHPWLFFTGAFGKLLYPLYPQAMWKTWVSLRYLCILQDKENLCKFFS